MFEFVNHRMCSDCGEEEPEVEEPQVDTEAPRSLRGRTKIRKPGKYRHSCEGEEDDLRILGETRRTDKRPSATQVSIALSEVCFYNQIFWFFKTDNNSYFECVFSFRLKLNHQFQW